MIESTSYDDQLPTDQKAADLQKKIESGELPAGNRWTTPVKSFINKCTFGKLCKPATAEKTGCPGISK